jgi:hypothetical protein
LIEPDLMLAWMRLKQGVLSATCLEGSHDVAESDRWRMVSPS